MQSKNEKTEVAHPLPPLPFFPISTDAVFSTSTFSPVSLFSSLPFKYKFVKIPSGCHLEKVDIYFGIHLEEVEKFTYFFTLLLSEARRCPNKIFRSKVQLARRAIFLMLYIYNSTEEIQQCMKVFGKIKL